MTPFISAVAKAYYNRYSDLSEFCFVFPSKRAGTFFLRALSSYADNKPIVAPYVTSVAELAETLSGRISDNRIDLLFILYKAYLKILEKAAQENNINPQETAKVSFDDFRSWGETVIRDFGEIDMYCVNPDEIFKNLKDLREISADYLTEEQRRVMEEYFGYQPGMERSATESFWKSFEPDTQLKGSFLLLWQTMGPLYHAFEEELAARGLTTPAGAYRLTLQAARDGILEIPWQKMVFVGFNALSLVERELFKEFTTYEDYIGPDGPEPFADFFWDGTGPLLSSKNAAKGPAKFLTFNRRDFPQPEWSAKIMSESDVDSLPDSIRVIACPSNSYQAKIVGNELYRLKEELPQEDFDNARVAVVLPDENLLTPILYSLPENESSVNLTMGYPMKLTSTASFIALYRLLHLHSHNNKESIPSFYHRDLRRLIAHPFVHAVVGSTQVEHLNRWLNESHKMNPTLPEITRYAPGIAEILNPLPANATPQQAASNIAHTLRRISVALESFDGASLIKSKLDCDHINIYLDSLSVLLSAVEEHSISMSAHTFFSLADKLLAGEQVQFQGEPLKGLQIMGMLETRVLDFDRVIIPSANERKLPVKGRTSSFLPNSLRAGYHMPPMQHQENLASYYFHRLISRAKEVIIIYDSRSGAGFGSEPSRYIMQLKHILAPDKIKFEDATFTLAAKGKAIEEISKGPRTMEFLNRFLNPQSGLNLSASAIKTYCDCGLRFFYERIGGIKTDSEPSDYIDSIEQGQVVHDVMLELYLPPTKRNILLDQPMIIDREYIINLKKNIKYIDQLIKRSINRFHFHLPDDELSAPLPPTAELVAQNIRWWILNILDRDLEQAPILIYGCEFDENIQYPMNDGRKVNMRFVIDRLDRPAENAESGMLFRIVDYKTSNLDARDYKNLDPEQLFYNGDKKGYAPQPLIYGELLNYWLTTKELKEMELDFALYNVPKMSKRNRLTEAVIKFYDPENKEYREVEDLQKKFRESFRNLLAEIFDPETPFRAAIDQEKSCAYCPLGNLCGR